MISEYHRPKTVEEALQLLGRAGIETVPMGGGSALNRPSKKAVAVVDLQDLGLDIIHDRGNFLEIGATVTLHKLLETEDLPIAFYQAIRHEATNNLRRVATLAGTVLAADGRSPLVAVLLAMDTALSLAPGDEQIDLGEVLISKAESLRRRIVTTLAIPLNVSLAYQYVARTPADLPVVSVAAAQWPSGRTRLALGGCGKSPILAFDGPEPGGAEAAARNAFSQAGDQWASAEYRQEVAGILTRRCLEELSQD